MIDSTGNKVKNILSIFKTDSANLFVKFKRLLISFLSENYLSLSISKLRYSATLSMENCDFIRDRHLTNFRECASSQKQRIYAVKRLSFAFELHEALILLIS